MNNRFETLISRIEQMDRAGLTASFQEILKEIAKTGDPKSLTEEEITSLASAMQRAESK